MIKVLQTRLNLIALLLLAFAPIVSAQLDIDEQLRQRAKEEVVEDDTDRDRLGTLNSIYLVPRTGDKKAAFVDTLKLNYYHRAFVEGRSVAEAYTGTFASPYQSAIYFDRPLNRWEDFYFTQPYHHLIRHQKRMQWYDTKSPYTFLSYRTIGLGHNREQNFSATFTSNLGKRWNLGGDIDIDYANGIYAYTSSNNITYRVFASYQGDRYQAFASVGNTNTINQESGGITDMRYITHPDDFIDGRRALLPEDIPTKFTATWNRVIYGSGRLHHKYSLGFYREEKEGDSSEEPLAPLTPPTPEGNLEEIIQDDATEVAPPNPVVPDETEEPEVTPDEVEIEEEAPQTPVRRIRSGQSSGQAEAPSDDEEGDEAEESTRPRGTFVPVTNIFHDFHLENGHRYFVSQDPKWSELYPTPIIPRLAGTTYYPFDSFSALKISNALGIELLEGFHNWAKMGIAAFVAFDYKHFTQPLIQKDDAERLDLPFEQLERKENTTYVGGRISSDSFKYFKYYVWGQVGVAGAQAGEIEIDGVLSTDIPIGKHQLQIKATTNFMNIKPSYFLQRYKASLIEWEQELAMMQLLRIGGEVALPTFGTSIHVNVETLQNPIYASQEAKPIQETGNIRVLAVGLDQKLSWKALNWENSIIWQKASNTTITPLPELSVYSNLYLQLLIAKVMTLQIGLDAKWHTEYFAPYYEPISQLFRAQEEIKLGGKEPLLTVYANAHLKRARFFVAYHNVGAHLFKPAQFTMPYYPTYPPTLRLGLAVDLLN